MYKLVFADDETLVRNNIARLIKWEEYGFTLTGCCANGHELLELAENEQPDLVITDINMPFLDGIEAARQLKKEFPDIKVIFLTGYNEFKYAQQALELQALKYILKPVTAENIAEVLKEVKQILDQEHQIYGNLTMLENFYEKNKDTIQNLFLYDLLIGNISVNEVQNKIHSLGIEWLRGNRFRVAVLDNDGNQNPEEWQSVSTELLNVAIYNISQELTGNLCIGSVLVVNGHVVILFCGFSSENDKGFQQKIGFCVEEIRTAIQRHLKFTITAGMGRMCESYSAIHNSYDEAVSALAYRASIGSNRIIYIEDIEPQRHQNPVFDRAKETQLLECVKLGNKEEMLQMVEKLIQETACERLESSRIYVLGILMSLIREAENLELDMQQLLQVCNIKKVLELSDREELYRTLVQACVYFFDHLSENRKRSCSKSMLAAVDYIQQQYMDSELCISMVCEHLHLSESYFRSIFKKELGTTFRNYLTQIRMEHAKQLLCSTNMRNYEIAEKIGYADSHYFSFCFKRFYNMAPNEMRDKLSGT